MRFFEALVTAFFRTFGITQPTQQTLRRAAWYMLGMLVLLVIGFCAVGAAVFHILRT